MIILGPMAKDLGKITVFKRADEKLAWSYLKYEWWHLVVITNETARSSSVESKRAQDVVAYG